MIHTAPVGAGLRAAEAREVSQRAAEGKDATDIQGPGVLILDRRGNVELSTPSAERWLANSTA
jgi:hypothetical protein